MDCVRKIYCPKDKATLQALQGMKVMRYEKVTRKLYRFSEAKDDWVLAEEKLVEGGTTEIEVDGKKVREVMIKASASCEEAATILYHEHFHTTQKDVTYPHPGEDLAYAAAEKWTIDRGLPGWPGLEGKPMRKKVGGKWVPDPDKIKQHVDKEYVASTDADDKVKEVTVERHRRHGSKIKKPDGTFYRRPPKEGDEFVEFIIDKPEDIPPEEFTCGGGKKK